MSKSEKRPDKIDMEEVLGAEPGDAGEIELLDPETGHPVSDQAPGTASRSGERGGSALEAPGEELQAALAEKQKYYDLWVRSRADFDNFRKRIEREREEERSQAGASLVREILPVLDNLERALAGVEEGDPFHDGVALIHRQLRDCLARFGVEEIQALGAPFNPVYHEAVATESRQGFEPNRVLEEAQKGYLFRGRVLRPSLVRVTARPEGTARGEDTVGKKADEAEGVPGGDEE